MLEVALTGILLGSLYALGAVGFTLLFGVARVLNFSHGALMVMAAYICWWTTHRFGTGVVPLALSVVLACAVTVIVAYLVNLLAVQPTQRRTSIGVHKREAIILAATLLAAVVIEEITSHVFGSQPITTALAVPGRIEVFGTTILTARLIVGLVAAALLLGFWAFLNRTRTGIGVLASAISPKGVAISGVSLRRSTQIVWVAYGLMTGLAGVLTAAFVGVSNSSAMAFSVTAFAVVVLGGLGSIPGTAVAAVLLGVAETATTFWISPALAGLPALIVMIVTIVVRPSGLFGRKES